MMPTAGIMRTCGKVEMTCSGWSVGVAVGVGVGTSTRAIFVGCAAAALESGASRIWVSGVGIRMRAILVLVVATGVATRGMLFVSAGAADVGVMLSNGASGGKPLETAVELGATVVLSTAA